MLIRAAHPSEAEACWRLRNQSICHGCKAVFPPAQIAQWTPDQMPEAWPSLVMNPGFFVAEGEGQLLATGLLDATTARIEAMFVAPDWQGRGLGRHLLQHLLTRARQQGLAAVSLSATPNAVAFYAALGFEQQEGGCYVSPTGLQLDCKTMRKVL